MTTCDHVAVTVTCADFKVSLINKRLHKVVAHTHKHVLHKLLQIIADVTPHSALICDALSLLL